MEDRGIRMSRINWSSVYDAEVSRKRNKRVSNGMRDYGSTSLHDKVKKVLGGKKNGKATKRK